MLELNDPPRNPAPTPARRESSIRRTSPILMHWPDGFGTQLQLEGRARDVVTNADGDEAGVREDALQARVAVDRTIEEIAADPPRPELERLVGASGGGRLRAAIADAVPDDRDAGTPLYLLLDDLAGATLIAPFAWSQSDDGWMERARERLAREATKPRQPGRNMQGVCAGFRPGSSALSPDGSVDLTKRHNVASVPPLVAPDDPMGWHEVPPHPTIAMRRARRIDVWRTDGDIVVDAMFRDSCWRPDGTEVAVHEYGLDAVIDAGSGLVVSVHAEPRVLPYPECPAAAPNVSWLTGVAASGLRAEVLDRLRGVDCCTHLNDALRALAEVPLLADLLDVRDLERVRPDGGEL
jgi:hypothetical protein